MLEVAELDSLDPPAREEIVRQAAALETHIFGSAHTECGFRQALAQPRARLVVAVPGCAGYCLYSSGSLAGRVVKLAVAEEHRGAGLGARLLGAALDALRRQGKSCVTLAVEQDRAAAVRLYRRAGFTVDADDGDEYRMVLEWG